MINRRRIVGGSNTMLPPIFRMIGNAIAMLGAVGLPIVVFLMVRSFHGAAGPLQQPSASVFSFPLIAALVMAFVMKLLGAIRLVSRLVSGVLGGCYVVAAGVFLLLSLAHQYTVALH